MKLKIKAPKDFWAGLMFISVGLFFMAWALTHYQMGSAVRMGPAYFPAVLGGLLAFLGLLVLIEAFAVEGPPLVLPFNIVDFIVAILLFFVLGWIFKAVGVNAEWAILFGSVALIGLSVLFRKGTMPLVLSTASAIASTSARHSGWASTRTWGRAARTARICSGVI